MYSDRKVTIRGILEVCLVSHGSNRPRKGRARNANRRAHLSTVRYDISQDEGFTPPPTMSADDGRFRAAPRNKEVKASPIPDRASYCNSSRLLFGSARGGKKWGGLKRNSTLGGQSKCSY